MMSEQTYLVPLTLEEIKGLRMGLVYGVPDPTPPVLVAARTKLRNYQDEAERQEANGA